jgi:hypothetical protein
MENRHDVRLMLLSIIVLSLVAPALRTAAGQIRNAGTLGNSAPRTETLSSGARASRTARAHRMGANQTLAEMEASRAQTLLESAGFGALQNLSSDNDNRQRSARQANADWNGRPQIESSIAVHPFTGQWVIAAADYGIGNINSAIYNSEGVNYFPPFPGLVGFDGATFVVAELPQSSNEAVAYGFTRAADDVTAGKPVVYFSTLGYSPSFCENGVFVSRSLDNGATWSRPIHPYFLPPKGRGTVAYWDQVYDCTIFHDKDYMAVDNTGGPHNGRVYVTWTKFTFGDTLQTNTINMAYSDDNGLTFSAPMVVSGHSDALCPSVISAGPPLDFPTPIGTPGGCDIDQFSYPVVLPDGTLVVVFENGQSPTRLVDSGRGQMLVTRINPDTLAVSGPFKVAGLFDGYDDHPVNSIGFPTICNANFFTGVSTGNIAVDQGGTLYAVWYDNRANPGQFPFPTQVGSAPPYACPAGKSTDTGVYLSRSSDRGTTWSTPQLVSSKPPGQGPHDQFQSWVAAGPRGFVDVVFYDRRYDKQNQLADTTVARSTDGGRTFRQIKVSDFSSNYDQGLFGGPGSIGAYLGMTMDRFGVSYPAWTGVKPGKLDSDTFMSIVGRDR